MCSPKLDKNWSTIPGVTIILSRNEADVHVLWNFSAGGLGHYQIIRDLEKSTAIDMGVEFFNEIMMKFNK